VMLEPPAYGADPATAPVSRRLRRPDGVGVLTVYLTLLLVVPARLTIGALGAVGSPATLVGVAAAVVWCWAQATRGRLSHIQPVRLALLAVTFLFLTSYVIAVGQPRAIDEVQGADIALLSVVSWVGIALLAHDTVHDRRRLYRLLERLSLLGAFFAAVGITQFVTGWQLTNLIEIPGLSWNSALNSVFARAGFNRPASTATHSIEFSVALAAMLPLAIHVAMEHRWLSPLRRWWPVVVMGMATPLAISRSGLVGLGVGMMILFLGWDAIQRKVGLIVMSLFVVVMFIVFPGLIGSLLSLFTRAGSDTSIRSRTDSYDLAEWFIGRSPLLGRGLGTFMPKYRILDNQYLMLLIETGIIGLVAFVGLFFTAIVCAQIVRGRTNDAAMRHLAQATTASVAACAAGYALFDGFSFPQFTGLTFFCVGLAGALWRAGSTWLATPGNEAGDETAAASRVAGRPRP